MHGPERLAVALQPSMQLLGALEPITFVALGSVVLLQLRQVLFHPAHQLRVLLHRVVNLRNRRGGARPRLSARLRRVFHRSLHQRNAPGARLLPLQRIEVQPDQPHHAVRPVVALDHQVQLPLGRVLLRRRRNACLGRGPLRLSSVLRRRWDLVTAARRHYREPQPRLPNLTLRGSNAGFHPVYLQRSAPGINHSFPPLPCLVRQAARSSCVSLRYEYPPPVAPFGVRLLVAVAQFGRALDCGSSRRGFDPRRSPKREGVVSPFKRVEAAFHARPLGRSPHV